MIALIRNWLIAVTCAALIAAVAQAAMPEGAIKQVGKLLCGMVILLAVVRPAMGVQISDAVGSLRQMQNQTRQQRTQLEESSGAMLKSLIERESSAYISDKAAEIEIHCQVQVSCHPGQGGTWVPWTVQITGDLNQIQRSALARIIQQELDIPSDRQQYVGGESGEVDVAGHAGGPE